MNLQKFEDLENRRLSYKLWPGCDLAPWPSIAHRVNPIQQSELIPLKSRMMTVMTDVY
jgi:hypothetical protein